MVFAWKLERKLMIGGWLKVSNFQFLKKATGVFGRIVKYDFIVIDIYI